MFVHVPSRCVVSDRSCLCIHVFYLIFFPRSIILFDYLGAQATSYGQRRFDQLSGENSNPIRPKTQEVNVCTISRHDAMQSRHPMN